MTDTTVAQTVTADLVDTYFAMWRATDAASRRALLEQAFTPDGRHVDPIADANGYDELDEMVGNVHAHYEGFRIDRTSGIDRHGNQLRFAWELRAADGSLVVAGLDVAEVASDGRLLRVAGFWGDLPEA
jgi:hypothetical protein